MKNTTALFFMTDSSILRRKRYFIPFVATFLSWLPLPAMAQIAEIYRYTTNADEVTLRVRVLGKNQVPIQGLRREDFAIETTDNQGRPVTLSPEELTLISSNQSQPDPAFLAIMLDMSGSMKQNDDTGAQKLRSSVDGIKDFIRQIRTENLSVELAILPYGEPGTDCSNTYMINQNMVGAKFLKATDEQLISQLDILANVKVCAATRIYEPLAEAVKYLGTAEKFQPTILKTDAPQISPPKLAVILLSDGFDVFRTNEQQRFQELLTVFKQYPQVTVHTMGYGEPLAKLSSRAKSQNLRSACNLIGSQLTVDALSSLCRLEKNDINEFIVDEPRLTKIAQATGGIHSFPASPIEVVKTLRTFLLTLREYEIKYKQPGGDRGSKHETKVRVNAPERQLDKIVSAPQTIDLGNFVYITLSDAQRYAILGSAIGLLIFAGILPFMNWSKNLKAKAERSL